LRSADQVATGGQAIPSGATRRAGRRRSRTNTMLSIRCCSSWRGLPPADGNPATSGVKWGALILLAIVIIGAEVNALVARGTGHGARRSRDTQGDVLGGFILS